MASRQGQVPSAAGGDHTGEASDSAPAAVVVRFLDGWRTSLDGAADFLAPGAKWMNNSLPAVRGRERIRKVVRALEWINTEVDVYVHTISVEGSTVMTERTDVLTWGPMRVQFWVCGRFDVEKGQIVYWQDYFDYLTLLAATARGLLGVFVPAARPKPPPGDWSGGITGPR
jgi:limonene-1,2-epoxide hydrolase